MKKALFVILTVFALLFGVQAVLAGQYEITADGQAFTFQSAQPINLGGYFYLPVRDVSDGLGGRMEWYQDARRAVVVMKDYSVTFMIDEPVIIIEYEDEALAIDAVAPPVLTGNRVYASLRDLIACFGGEVTWQSETNTAVAAFVSEGLPLVLMTDETPESPETPANNADQDEIMPEEPKANDADKAEETESQEQVEQENIEAAIHTGKAIIRLGESLATVERKLGKADRVDYSSHEFQWYIYNKNYEQYVQIGVDNADKVVAFYSNSASFAFSGLTAGASFEEMARIFDDIAENDSMTKISGEQYELVLYRDRFDDYRLSAIYVLGSDAQKRKVSYAPFELRSIESMTVDICNAERVKAGLSPLEINQNLYAIAKKHSEEMALQSELTHDSLDGRTLLERIEETSLDLILNASENIARGETTAMDICASWLDTVAYRSNILDDNLQFIGVGAVKSEDKYTVYTTADFYAPFN